LYECRCEDVPQLGRTENVTDGRCDVVGLPTRGETIVVLGAVTTAGRRGTTTVVRGGVTTVVER
jgi:hypothetical protein